MGDYRLGRKKYKCDTCVWQAPETAPHKCDFVTRTGRTRRAESPRECTWYLRGSRIGEGEDRRAAVALEKVLTRRSAAGLA